MIRTRPADDEPGDERQWSIEARVDLARPAIEAIARTLYGGRHDIELLVETLFGEDLISEKSLDEVILSYLAGDRGS